MSIRPMDMQVLIPKATEVSKIQQTEAHKENLQQQEFAMQLQKNMLDRQKQVQHTSESEGRKVEKDKDAKEKQKRSRKDGDKGKKGADPNIDPHRRGSILDINT